MERMAGPIVQIAHIVAKIDACDREIRRVNSIESHVGHIRPVLSGAAPAITALLGDAVVWDAFISVAELRAPPLIAAGASAMDKR
jgi:hypothetical protein